MALLGEFDKCKAVLKALISFAIFILGCAGVVYLLVTSSNAKAARGGDGFGMKWSLQDRIHDHNLNSNVFTDIQEAGGWPKVLLGIALFIGCSCVVCPLCCRYVFPLCIHLAQGGKWGESWQEFEERRRKEEEGEEAEKMETGTSQDKGTKESTMVDAADLI